MFVTDVFVFLAGIIQQTQSCLPDHTFTVTLSVSHKLIQLLFSVLVWRKWVFVVGKHAQQHQLTCQSVFCGFSVSFISILLFITEGTKPLTLKDNRAKSCFKYFLFFIVHLREERGLLFLSLQTGSRFREAELRTVTETGNCFNRLGLPLSALPQQAWRIIQDYRACLWSAIGARCQPLILSCLSCIKDPL